MAIPDDPPETEPSAPVAHGTPPGTASAAPQSDASPGAPFDGLVVCSLEPWDEVWRRNQFLVDALLHRLPALRVLFVEPAVDLPFELSQRRRPPTTGLRALRADGRLWAYRPRKLLPRMLAGEAVDRSAARRVRQVADRLGLARPVLWVNDTAYASLAREVTWPVFYDVTDDWTVSVTAERHLARRRAEDAALLQRADLVTVVSADLATSRGATRRVVLLPDAVDVAHFRRPQPRPTDLPLGPVAVYVGTLHEDRLDVALTARLAAAVAPASVVLVGPNCLRPDTTHQLTRAGCRILGARPYRTVPAYYQHADLVVVPHAVNRFTESLDPIKGYECLAVGTATLTTPVAGLRDMGPPIEVATVDTFLDRAAALVSAPPPRQAAPVADWAQRAGQLLDLLGGLRVERR